MNRQTPKLASANVQAAKRASCRTGSSAYVAPCVTIPGDVYEAQRVQAIARDIRASRPAAYG